MRRGGVTMCGVTRGESGVWITSATFPLSTTGSKARVRGRVRGRVRKVRGRVASQDSAAMAVCNTRTGFKHKPICKTVEPATHEGDGTRDGNLTPGRRME